jgi:hypothetical protein
MSIITKEFTKEQLVEHLRTRIEHRKGLIASMHIDRGYRDYLKLELLSSEIALASLEAEAVAYVDPFAFNNFSVYRAGDTDNNRMGREWMWANPDAGLIPVYTTPPASVSVPDEITFEKIAEITASQGYEYSINECICAASWWSACRAAMLQGADGALTNEDTKRVGELVMWVKRLARSLRKANPDSKLQSDAMDYLSRKGLIGVEDILR